MSIGQTFPDAIYDPNALCIRPVTFAARTWLYQNTSVKKICRDADHVPDRVMVVHQIVDLMRDDGLVIKRMKASPLLKVRDIAQY